MSQTTFGFLVRRGLRTMITVGIPIWLLLAIGQWPLAISSAQQADYSLDLPELVLEPIIPEDNPMTGAKVKLGKKLYFDKRLSVDDSVSCATCHDPKFGFADGRAVAEGIQKKKGARNSPTVLNTAFYDFQFWDGRVETLEEQAKQPITNPVEMGMPSHDAVVKKLREVPQYIQAFKEAFGTGDFNINHVVKAIASFERTLNTLNSPFDRFFKGDKNAISAKAQRGWEVFQTKGRCITCHKFNASYPFFTDNKFHNIGVAMKGKNFEALARKVAAQPKIDPKKLAFEADATELGRFLVTRKSKDIGAFKTSGLREIALTAPYMHNGSEPTLEAVVDFYDKGGIPNPYLDGGIRQLKLTKEEKSALVEFMKTLTSDDLPALIEKVESR